METYMIYAKDPAKIPEFKTKMAKYGFSEAENPDFIVSLGGDGTFLKCERKFPGIPKLLVRDSSVCFKCHNEDVDEVLEKISRGGHKVEEHCKLEAEGLVATNDIVIRNKEPTRGIRFRYRTDGEWSDVLIGDGMVISTPFGSTGYYYSITRESFTEGIGVAFNNTTRKREHFKLDGEIEIMIERGVAQLAADNNPNILHLNDHDVVTVRKSDEVCRILTHQ